MRSIIIFVLVALSVIAFSINYNLGVGYGFHLDTKDSSLKISPISLFFQWSLFSPNIKLGIDLPLSIKDSLTSYPEMFLSPELFTDFYMFRIPSTGDINYWVYLNTAMGLDFKISNISNFDLMDSGFLELGAGLDIEGLAKAIFKARMGLNKNVYLGFLLKYSFFPSNPGCVGMPVISFDSDLEIPKVMCQGVIGSGKLAMPKKLFKDVLAGSVESGVKASLRYCSNRDNKIHEYVFPKKDLPTKEGCKDPGIKEITLRYGKREFSMNYKYLSIDTKKVIESNLSTDVKYAIRKKERKFLLFAGASVPSGCKKVSEKEWLCKDKLVDMARLNLSLNKRVRAFVKDGKATVFLSKEAAAKAGVVDSEKDIKSFLVENFENLGKSGVKLDKVTLEGYEGKLENDKIILSLPATPSTILSIELEMKFSSNFGEVIPPSTKASASLYLEFPPKKLSLKSPCYFGDKFVEVISEDGRGFNGEATVTGGGKLKIKIPLWSKEYTASATIVSSKEIDEVLKTLEDKLTVSSTDATLVEWEEKLPEIDSLVAVSSSVELDYSDGKLILKGDLKDIGEKILKIEELSYRGCRLEKISRALKLKVVSSTGGEK